MIEYNQSGESRRVCAIEDASRDLQLMDMIWKTAIMYEAGVTPEEAIAASHRLASEYEIDFEGVLEAADLCEQRIDLAIESRVNNWWLNGKA